MIDTRCNGLGRALALLVVVHSMACQQTSPEPSTVSSGAVVTAAPSASLQAPTSDGGFDAGSDPCAEVNPKALVLGEKAELEPRARYRVAGTSLSVCVLSTSRAWTMLAGKNHERRGCTSSVSASFALEDGDEHVELHPGADRREHLIWRDYKISYGEARHAAEGPLIWVLVEAVADAGH